MKKILWLAAFFATLLVASTNYHEKNNCLKCHGGIEHIRAPESGMAKAIAKKAAEAGYAKNAVLYVTGEIRLQNTKAKRTKGLFNIF